MALLDEKFFAELLSKEKQDDSNIPIGWLSTHSGLIETMRLRRKQMPEKVRPQYSACKLNSDAELNKLFEIKRDMKDQEFQDVKHFLINRALDQFRPNIQRLSSKTLIRMLNFSREFDEMDEHRKEIYDFLLNCLEQRPPLYTEMRWFWLCVVTASTRHTNSNDDGHVRDAVTEFGKQCIATFKNYGYRPYEYQLFVLTLLEYDYAALIARLRYQSESSSGQQQQDQQRSPIKSTSSTSSGTGRRPPVNTMADIDKFPLAYLLLCNVKPEQGTLVEKSVTGTDGLENLLQDLVLNFTPKTKPIPTLRLFARLIGLLLDVLLFIDNGADPYYQLTVGGLDQIKPDKKVGSLVRKVRNMEFTDAEWTLFTDAAGAPWIRDGIVFIPEDKASLKILMTSADDDDDHCLQADGLLTPTAAGAELLGDDGHRQSATATSSSAPPPSPISKALQIAMEKKRAKIGRFLELYQDNLEAHMPQLTAFAYSSGGLLEDRYREKIWPLLAKNIPHAERYADENGISRSGTPSQSICSAEFLDAERAPKQQNNLEDFAAQKQQQLMMPMVSDSDFESALSTFSGSTDRDDYDEEMEEENGQQQEKAQVADDEELRSHQDWNQVELDVARTLARFPPYLDETDRAQLQRELTPLIVTVLWEQQQFQYYQGFHDVCLTFLLALGPSASLQCVRALCHHGAFRNYLSCTLEQSALRELQDLYVLLFMHDQEVERRLRGAELGTLFALSWPLTWFSHALRDYEQIVLFFDLFLCSHHLMPIYVSAALVSERREQVLRCDADMPSLHQLLNHIPADINCHRVLDTARALMDRYPPGVLSEFRAEYLRICERHRRLLAVERLHQRMELDIAINEKRRRSSTSSLLRRDSIYALAGAGAVVVLGAAVAHYWPYRPF